MKITKFTLENARALRKLDYIPENKIGILCGHNGIGKTTFAQGLAWGLTGKFPEGDYINDASDYAKVELEICGETLSRKVHREKPTQVRYNGKTSSATAAATALEDVSGISRDALRVTTSQELLAAMPPEEFREFLMSFVPETTNVEFVLDCVSKLAPTPMPTGTLEEIEGMFPAMPIKFPLSKIEEVYAAAYENRSYYNKVKNQLLAKINPAFEQPPVRPISAVEAERESISIKEGSRALAVEALRLYNEAVERRKKGEEEIERLQAEIDKITITKPNDKERCNLEANIASRTKDIANVQKFIGTMQGSIDVFTNTLDKLNTSICPISERLICTTDKGDLKEEIDEIINANREGIKLQEEVLEKLKDEKMKEEESLKIWWNNSALYQKKVLLTEQLLRAKKNLPAIPKKPSVPSEEEDYEKRKKELAIERKYCEEYEKNRTYIVQANAASEKYEIMNYICSIFAPKGCVMNEIASSYLHIFEDSINDRAAKLGCDYEVKFEINKGIVYSVKTPLASTFVTYHDLSCGEQLVAMFLLLDMLNSLCGTRIMILDDLNHLDGKNFEALLSFIRNPAFLDDYDHVILCIAENDDFLKIISGASDIDRIM